MKKKNRRTYCVQRLENHMAVSWFRAICKLITHSQSALDLQIWFVHQLNIWLGCSSLKAQSPASFPIYVWLFIFCFVFLLWQNDQQRHREREIERKIDRKRKITGILNEATNLDLTMSTNSIGVRNQSKQWHVQAFAYKYINDDFMI